MSNWISVEDHLPDYGKKVLLSCLGDGLQDPRPRIDAFVGYRSHTDGEGESWKSSDFDLLALYHIDVPGEVTHWQPLPEPPKSE